MSKEYVLYGIIQTFSHSNPCNGRTYPKEVFEKELRKFEIQMTRKQRKKKLEKIYGKEQ